MSIEPVLKVACDLCGEFRHKTAIDGAPAPLPDGWHHTANRGYRGPAYCLDGVEIICDSCHDKISNTVQQIKADAATTAPEER